MGPVKRVLARKLIQNQSLISLDDPYRVMKRLLGSYRVRGIVDVGASYGRVSLRLMKHFPHATTWGFEPNPAYRQVLDDLHERQPRFIPLGMALGDRTGTARLHITASPGVTSLFQPNSWFVSRYPDQTAVVDSCDVDLTTIDAWLASEAFETPVDLIKLDIQGGELAALQGARDTLTNQVRLVYSEVLFNPLYEGGTTFAELDAYLRTCGFALYDLYKPKYDADGMIMWGNAIFVHRERI